MIYMYIKVFRLAYCIPFCYDKVHYYRESCQQFMSCISSYMPEYSKRLKSHLVLHLVDHMCDFGPTDCYNTERYNIFSHDCNNIIMLYFSYEAFNGLMRAQIIFGNRHSPSKDICQNFAVLQYLRFICCGGYYNKRQYVIFIQQYLIMLHNM